jgi:general secretion pathway protein N
MMTRWRDRRAVTRASRWPGSGSFTESTLAQLAWERKRNAVVRWSWAGALCGMLCALVAFAPATLVAQAVAAGTHQRVLLSDARGTVWRGSAVPVLTGGIDSRSATVVPGRTNWSVGVRGLALELRVAQSCCLPDDLVLRLRPGLGRMVVELPRDEGIGGEWPAAWLAGLGAPWNTLQLDGMLRLASPGLSLEVAAGRWQLVGQAELELIDISSRLSPLDRLGSYRVHIDGGSAGAASQGPMLTLSTLDGKLLLSGQGQWTGSQLRFRGEARAAPGFESALDNLLNIFGRRQGALSIISIG